MYIQRFVVLALFLAVLGNTEKAISSPYYADIPFDTSLTLTETTATEARSGSFFYRILNASPGRFKRILINQPPVSGRNWNFGAVEKTPKYFGAPIIKGRGRSWEFSGELDYMVRRELLSLRAGDNGYKASTQWAGVKAQRLFRDYLTFGLFLGAAQGTFSGEEKRYILWTDPGFAWGISTKIAPPTRGSWRPEFGGSFRRSYMTGDKFKDTIYNDTGLNIDAKIKVTEWGLDAGAVYENELSELRVISTYLGLRLSGMRVNLNPGWLTDDDDTMVEKARIGIKIGTEYRLAKTREESRWIGLYLRLLNETAVKLDFHWGF